MDKESPKNVQTKTSLRMERVKQAMLTRGFTMEELAVDEGVSTAVIAKDIREIKRLGILKEAQAKTALAFLGYAEDVNWSIEEAKRLHKEEIEDEGTGGRLDCLAFVAARRKEEIEVAQKLGLLEVAAEKHQITHEVKVDLKDTKLVKDFGDWLASQQSS